MIESTLSFADLAEEIGATVAAPAAGEVDREARFPREAAEAMRERGLLSALVPVEYGGPGASVAEISAAVRVLARHCAASALVLAMHSIDLSNLVRNPTTDAQIELLRSLPERPLLFANANSEVGLGGEAGRSRCAIETVDGAPRLVKEALAISYGEYADVVCTVARRTPESEETDQALAICRRFELEPLSEWDSIGLRGTCSRSFRLTAEIDPELVYPGPAAAIFNSGGAQVTLLLLSSVWVGLADAAAATAHAYVRAAARRQIGTIPRSATRLAELGIELDRTRDLLEVTSRRLGEALGTEEIESPALLASLRSLKIGTSQGAVAVATAALEICGIAGYKRDSRFSLDRNLRDALGGLVMVSNDRFLHVNAEMLIARKQL